MSAETHKMDEVPPTARLLATEDTHNALGWIGNKVPEITGIDTLVITREDIAVSRDPLYEAGDLLDRGADPFAVVNWQKTERNLKSLFEQAGFPENYFTDQDITTMATAIVFEDTSAMAFDLDDDGRHDIGLIMGPDLYATPAENIASLTGVTSTRLMNLPGDTEDYLAFTMFHESRHIAYANEGPTGNDTYAYTPLPFEVDADQAAINEYASAIREGHDLDPAVLQTIKDARTVGSMTAGGNPLGGIANIMGISSLGQALSHSTGEYLHIDNGLPQLDDTATNQAAFDSSMINMTVNTVLGNQFLSELMAQSDSGADIQNTLDQYGLTSTDLIGIADNPLQLSEIGALYGQMNPGASFAALERLHEKGYFRGYPTADEYAAKISNFHEKHIPGITNETGYSNITQVLTTLPVFNDTEPTADEPRNLEHDKPTPASPQL